MIIKGVILKQVKQLESPVGGVPGPSARVVAVALAVAVISSGCATQGAGVIDGVIKQAKQVYASDDPCSNNARNIGITVGTVGGALAGQALGGDGHKTTGAIVGAGLGALIGGLIGQDMDRRRCELSKIAKANNLELTINDIALPVELAEDDATPAKRDESTKVVGMSVSVTETREQFAAGSARPTANAASTFTEIAKTYQIDAGSDATPELRQQAATRARQMRILLIGHTDDTGSSQVNADLSEARAKAVARIFAQNGFSTDQIYYQGAGETLPVADNRTEAGRAKNRRVEIVDLSDEQAFARFLASRKPNLAYYRPADEMAAASGSDTNAKPAPPKSRPGKSSTKVAGTSTAPVPQDKPAAKAAERPAREAASAGSGKAASELPAQAATTKTASAPTPERRAASKGSAPAARAAEATAGIDFGGSPVGAQSRVPDIGKPAPQAASFSLISSANADELPPVSSCTQDRPRVKHGVKSLKNDQVARFSTKDYMAGVYGTSWSDTVNGHLVALTNVTVLRDGGQPVTRPDILVYKNYTAGTNPKPDFSMAADANAYQGSKAMLYRVFLASGPLRCIDMVIPYKAASTAPGSTLVYQRNSALFQADFAPSIAR